MIMANELSPFFRPREASFHWVEETDFTVILLSSTFLARARSFLAFATCPSLLIPRSSPDYETKGNSRDPSPRCFINKNDVSRVGAWSRRSLNADPNAGGAAGGQGNHRSRHTDAPLYGAFGALQVANRHHGKRVSGEIAEREGA